MIIYDGDTNRDKNENKDDDNGDGNDDDDDNGDDDDDVHVVYLLTRLTGVSWIWWTTFAGACVVVQGSTIVAHSATTVCNNIIFKLTPWIQNSPTLVNKLGKVHIWKIEN